MKATLSGSKTTKKRTRCSSAISFSLTKPWPWNDLREYAQAAVYYRKAAEIQGRLGAEATKNADILVTFLRILDKPLSTEDPFKHMEGLDEKVGAWNELIQKHSGTHYEFLARVEEERIDRAKVTFVEANRYRLREGNQLVVLGYGQLVTKHRQSKNIHRFLLDFGDFYTVLAKEYASQYDPEGLSFDFKAFDEFAKSALKLYAEVAQVDGILEKVEAQGKTRGHARARGENHEDEPVRCEVLRLARAFFFAAACFLSGASAQAQDIERALEKILNPLPDIDPFEKPPETPRFFPDEVDKRARDLMVDALLNRQDAINQHLSFLNDADARLQKQHGATTGLTETAQDLANNLIQDRGRFLAAQKEALKSATSPERKKYLEAIINHDDLTQSDLLARQSTYQFLGRHDESHVELR